MIGLVKPAFFVDDTHDERKRNDKKKNRLRAIFQGTNHTTLQSPTFTVRSRRSITGEDFEEKEVSKHFSCMCPARHTSKQYQRALLPSIIHLWFTCTALEAVGGCAGWWLFLACVCLYFDAFFSSECAQRRVRSASTN